MEIKIDNNKESIVDICRRHDEMRLIHIISRGNKWAVVRRPNKKATKIFKFRDQAYFYARSIGDKIVVHNKDADVDFTFGIELKR